MKTPILIKEIVVDRDEVVAIIKIQKADEKNETEVCAIAMRSGKTIVVAMAFAELLAVFDLRIKTIKSREDSPAPANISKPIDSKKRKRYN